MRRILVTGAKGMLGQDLCPMLDQNGFEVIPSDYQEMDITDLKQVESFIDTNTPGMIIHCAAYTNVDKAEEDKDNAFLINEKEAKTSQKFQEKKAYRLLQSARTTFSTGRQTNRIRQKTKQIRLMSTGLQNLQVSLQSGNITRCTT